MTHPGEEKRMRLRYAGSCRVCGAALEARVEAVYERRTKSVRCLGCPPTNESHGKDADVAGALGPVVPADSGTPGGSARREFERRHAKREARVRRRHPRLGRLILAVSNDPQSTSAWSVGALGEERLGKRLNELSGDTMRVLHDRRILGTRTNIDHIAVTPSGIYVIDAKRYINKRPALRVEGGLFRPRVEKLTVGGRDQTKLVDGVRKQVDVVKGLLGPAAPVVGVLCFIEADWPMVGGAFVT